MAQMLRGVSWLSWLLVVGIATTLPSGLSGQGASGSGNAARGEVSLIGAYSTPADILENLPVAWNHKWQFDLLNEADTAGQAIVNPTFELQTSVLLANFSRPPDVQSPLTWYFGDLQVNGFPPRHLPENLFLTIWAPAPDPPFEAPRLRVARTASPQVLTTAETLQTVLVTLTIQEPIDFGPGRPAANAFHVSIGDVPVAFGGYMPVTHQIVSQAQTPGWFAWTNTQQALWAIDPQTLQVGQTYTFEATLKTIKAADLLGSPVHMPRVALGYGHRTQQVGPLASTSAMIQHPLAPLTLTFRTDTVVDWSRVTNGPRRDLSLEGRVSNVTPPPVRRVIVPASVRIEPEVVNLGAKGVISAFVEVPAPYRIEDIDVRTARCQGAPATFSAIAANTLILKCDVQQLQRLTPGNRAELLVNGLFADGSLFQGTDAVRVIR